MSFISSYLENTSIYESPLAFWKWSSFASIAAVLKDKCYLPQGNGRLYSNIYVLFLAASSGHRKGRPVDVSEKMVHKINNTKIISGRTSVQAIMDELARTETNKHTGKVMKSNSAVFYAAELSAGIVSDPEAISVLTDIYDYKSNPYKNRLRTGPCFNLERIVLTMLMASNEAMIKEFYNSRAIEGGMLARTCLVTPNERRPPNSLMRLNQDQIDKKDNFDVENLSEIAKLNGPFIQEEEATEEYEKWYHPFNKTYLAKPDSSGIYGRIHTTVLKVAMLLAANDLSLQLRKHHIEQAIDECYNILPNYAQFTMNNGRNELAQLTGLVIMELVGANEHVLNRKEIVSRLWTKGVDPETLDKIGITLETAGMLTLIQNKNGMFFKLTDECLATMSGATKVKTVGKGWVN